MSKSNQTPESPKAPEVDQVRASCMALSDTSKKIRFLSSQGMLTAQIEKTLKVYGVTTKNGDPIRYQHVRNVLLTRLTTK